MFNDMKVGTRLAIAFGVVLVLLIAVVAIGVSRMANINAQLRSIADENVVQMRPTPQPANDVNELPLHGRIAAGVDGVPQ